MTVRALCVGQNYTDTGMALSWCIYDAERMRNWILSNAPTAEITFLTDQSAEQILAELGEFVDSLAPGDLGFLCYSGHGTHVADREGDDLEPDGRDECWVGHPDGQVITDDEIRARLVRAQAPIAVYSDSCFSGSVTRLLKPGVAIRTIPSPDPAAPVATVRGRILPTGGSSPVLLHSGCRDNEYSYETGGTTPGGVFTTALIQSWQPGMTHKAQHKAIRAAINTNEFPQHPQLFGSKKMPARLVFPV